MEIDFRFTSIFSFASCKNRMTTMHPNKLLLAACALVLAGCSSTPTKVDTGPIRARTFSFVNTGPRQAPANADDRQAIHAMIQEAIKKNLAARGVTRAAAGGDVTVAYLVVTGNN